MVPEDEDEEVEMMPPTEPPSIFVQTAIGYANQSPCQKSQRGAVIYEHKESNVYIIGDDRPIGRGYNGLPSIQQCDGSEACRRDCGKICVHAESRAIRNALTSPRCFARSVLYQTPGGTRISPLINHRLIHVKTVDGDLVAGGQPSCWQCSKDILDCGLDGVWLFELDDAHPTSAAMSGKGTWRYYTARHFHEVTLQNIPLHRAPRP